MPLLLCPNDNGSMQSVTRSGVEFDICPQCRGVWLDRGELEKLLAAADGDPTADRAAPQQPWSPPQPDRSQMRRDRYSDDDYRRPKKRSSIFDIFD